MRGGVSRASDGPVQHDSVLLSSINTLRRVRRACTRRTVRLTRTSSVAHSASRNNHLGMLGAACSNSNRCSGRKRPYCVPDRSSRHTSNSCRSPYRVGNESRFRPGRSRASRPCRNGTSRCSSGRWSKVDRRTDWPSRAGSRGGGAATDGESTGRYRTVRRDGAAWVSPARSCAINGLLFLQTDEQSRCRQRSAIESSGTLCGTPVGSRARAGRGWPLNGAFPAGYARRCGSFWSW